MIGTRLANRYELLGELGRGGMAVVYRAHDPRLDREVAIKVIAVERLAPSVADRFQREAELIAGLDHPSIVPVFDFGREGRWLFLVMPVLRGANLHQMMRRQRLLLDTTLEVAARAAEALAYSSARGIVHRDVKPENLMVSLDENDRLSRLWVMDFGLAVGDLSIRLTRTGNLPGTLAYLSPEQIVTGEVDGRSDLYSLGVILYECLAGRPPFSGSPASVLYRIVNEDASSLVPYGIDERLESLVMRCLQKTPADRFQDGDELAAALRDYSRHLLPDGRRLPQLTREGDGEALPLVGRERETSAVNDALSAALDGTCQLMLIGGERGLGTSRLAGEAASSARRRGFQVLRGRFSSQTGGVSYEAFGELIFDFFTQRRSSTSVGQSPIPALGDLGPELLRIFPVLREIPELSGSDPAHKVSKRAWAPTASSPALAATQEEPRHVFELIARTLSRLAGDRPQTLVIEQLQEADVSIQLLLYLVRRLGSTRTFIVGTYRPSGTSKSHPLKRLIRGLTGDPRCHHVVLEALDESDHRELIQNLLGGGAVREGVCEQLYEVTGGNPLFAQEVVRALWDSGDLELDSAGCWSLEEGDVLSRELPETVQQAVVARIERLGEGAIETLGTAAVLGRRFYYQDLEELWSGEDEEALEENIEALIQRRLLAEVPRTRGDQLSFESPLVREVVYARLPRRRRRRLHRRFAQRLEKRAGSSPERWLAELLHHFAEGDVPERAVHYGRLQAIRALENHCWDDALEAANLALEFVDDVVHAEAELRLILAEGHAGRGRPDAALREAARAVESFQSRGEKAAAARATVTLVEVAWKYRRMEAVTRWLETGLALARVAADVEGQALSTDLIQTTATLLHLAATAANLRGGTALAKRFLAEARELAGDLETVPEGQELRPIERLRVGMVGLLTTDDPALATSVPESEILANIFEPLFEMGAGGSAVPLLARSLSSDAGMRSYTLQLHDDRRFSDGTVLDAERVKRSLEEAGRFGARRLRPILSILVGGAEFLAGTRPDIEGLKVAGELELALELREEAPLFPAMLTSLGMSVALRRDGEVLGTGPYRLEGQSGGRWFLEQNQYHPSAQGQGPARLEFISLPSSRDVARALVEGEIDLGRDLAVPEIEDFLTRPTFHRSVQEKPSPNIAFLMLSRHGPATRDPKLRRILVGVLDSRETVWRGLGRFALPTGSWIPPGLLGHDPDAPSPRRLDRFEALGLVQDLQSPPRKLRILAHPIFRQRFRAVLESITNEWAMLGLKIEVEELPLGDVQKLRASAAEADLIFSRWYPDFSDPDAYTHGAFSTSDGLYGPFVGTPEIDAVLEEARHVAGPSRRDRLYRRVQRLLLHEDVIVPLFHDVDFRVSAPSIGGLEMLASPPYVDYLRLGRRSRIGEAPPPRPVGRLRLPLQDPIDHLDPARQVNVPALEVMATVFETLTRIDRRGSVVPHLAEKITSQEDGQVHRIELRQVLFHDGRRLRSHDVRASLERLLRHGTPHIGRCLSMIDGADAFQAGATEEIAGFVMHSERVFELRLLRPIEHFAVFLSDPSLCISPEGTENFATDWRRGCVGTGPFMVIDFEPGRRIEMKAHRDYWRQGRPRCQGLIFERLEPGTSPCDELRSGRAHLTSELCLSEVESLTSDARFAGGVQEHPAFSTFFLLFNRVNGPLMQVDVRRQVACHVESALGAVLSRLGRLGVPAQSLIPPGLLPAASGRPSWSRAEPPALDGLALEIAVHPMLLSQFADFWEGFREELQDRGILFNVHDGHLEAVRELASHRAIDVVAGRWVGDAPDPSSFASVVHSDDGLFGRLLCHEQVDRLVERGLEALENRHLIYAELERVLAEEALLWPLFHQQICCVCHPDVEGLRLGYGWPTIRYDELSLRC